MDSLLAKLAALPGVEQAPSQFNGSPALWVNGREIFHFARTHAVDRSTSHRPDVEIRLTRKLIRDVDDPDVVERTRTSDWVLVPARDEDKIVELTRRAIDANRRGPGA
jgi:Family of unknown function (DUF5519)